MTTPASSFIRLVMQTRALAMAARELDIQPNKISVTIPWDTFMEVLHCFQMTQVTAVHPGEPLTEFRMNDVLVKQGKPGDD